MVKRFGVPCPQCGQEKFFVGAELEVNRVFDFICAGCGNNVTQDNPIPDAIQEAKEDILRGFD